MESPKKSLENDAEQRRKLMTPDQVNGLIQQLEPSSFADGEGSLMPFYDSESARSGLSWASDEADEDWRDYGISRSDVYIYRRALCHVGLASAAVEATMAKVQVSQPE